MSRLRRNFEAVELTTQRWFYFDFSPELGANETIWTANFVCSVVFGRGADPAPQSRVLSVPVIIGNDVGAFCGNFLPGVWYSLEATAYTSAGNVLPSNARLYCQGAADR